MTQKKIIINFGVTIALLTVIAGIAIIGINMAMEPFTLYNFNVTDETSKIILLKMYRILKFTRIALTIMLFTSIVVKSAQFVSSKEIR